MRWLFSMQMLPDMSTSKRARFNYLILSISSQLCWGTTPYNVLGAISDMQHFRQRADLSSILIIHMDLPKLAVYI
jgi:hypothetical protein